MKFIVSTGIALLCLGMVDMQTSHLNHCMMLRSQEPSITSMDTVCYYFSKIELPWMQALNYCLNLGMILAEVANEAEFNNVVRHIASNGTHQHYWLGANNLDEQGDFTYVGSGKQIQYLSKAHTIDNSAGNENCMELQVLEQELLMNDDSCKKKHRFICQAKECDCFVFITTSTTTEAPTTKKSDWRKNAYIAFSKIGKRFKNFGK